MPRLDTTLGRAVPTTVMVLASIATLMIIGMIGGMWRQDSQRPCVHAVLCSTHDQRKDCESNNCAWQDAMKACNELQLFLPTDDPANEEGTRMNDVHFSLPLPSVPPSQSPMQINHQTIVTSGPTLEEPVCLRNPSYLVNAIAANSTHERLASTLSRFGDLLALASRQAGTRRTVILTVATFAYRTPLVNWLCVAAFHSDLRAIINGRVEKCEHDLATSSAIATTATTSTAATTNTTNTITATACYSTRILCLLNTSGPLNRSR